MDENLDQLSLSELRPHRLGSPVEVTTFGRPLEPAIFERCPMCLRKAELHKEHVPPESLGGSRLTKTCNSCNNGFGSIEDAWARRFRGQLHSARFRGVAVQGARAAGDVRVLQNHDDKFVILIDGSRADSELGAIFDGAEESELIAREANDSWYRVALLKHAYLAACIHLRAMPRSGDAESIRRELQWALGSYKDVGFEHGEQARRILTLAGRGTALEEGTERRYEVRFGVARLGQRTVTGLALGEAAFVEWPFRDVPPTSPLQIAPMWA